MTQACVKQIPVPTKLYGRMTKNGQMSGWAFAGYTNGLNTPVGSARYVSDKGTPAVLTPEGLLYGLRNGHLQPKDGKEILAWGAGFGAQLERLGINALLIYNGAGDAPSVYWLTDPDFDKLCADDDDNWHGVGACWRYADGATPMVHLAGNKRARVAGHYLEAWKDGGRRYDDLLTYLCDAMGCSTERNVAALTAELAQMNDMSLGALFTKYQPAEGSVEANG